MLSQSRVFDSISETINFHASRPVILKFISLGNICVTTERSRTTFSLFVDYNANRGTARLVIIRWRRRGRANRGRSAWKCRRVVAAAPGALNVTLKLAVSWPEECIITEHKSNYRPLSKGSRAALAHSVFRGSSHPWLANSHRSPESVRDVRQFFLSFFVSFFLQMRRLREERARLYPAPLSLSLSLSSDCKTIVNIRRWTQNRWTLEKETDQPRRAVSKIPTWLEGGDSLADRFQKR